MRRFLTLAIIALCSPFTLAEDAGQHVYTWTDEHGIKHYSKIAPSEDAERIRMRSAQPSVSAAKGEQTRAELREKARTAETAEARSADERSQALPALKQRRLALRCRQLQRRWTYLELYGPIYYENKPEGRVFLTDAQREAEKQKLVEPIEKACGQPPG